jgi:hypothetical protein
MTLASSLWVSKTPIRFLTYASVTCADALRALSFYRVLGNPSARREWGAAFAETLTGRALRWQVMREEHTRLILERWR